jgi:hypothetical protein
MSNSAASEREKTGTLNTQKKMRFCTPEDCSLLSRDRWKLNGRRVTVSDAEATKIMKNKSTGHKLPLFTIEQTEQSIL